MIDKKRMQRLRTAINEGVRVQRGGADPIPLLRVTRSPVAYNPGARVRIGVRRPEGAEVLGG